MNVGTIVARNYLPFARVLARSLREHEPSARFSVLLVDDEHREVDDGAEDFELVRPSDIGLSDLDTHHMATIYDVTEFSTALKPLFLRYLQERYPPTVVYLDPDIWVHAPLADLADLAETDGIALTPHRTVPLEPDDRTPSEGDLLSAGVFNLGFIALGPGTEPFLEWWANRLRFDAIRDIAKNLFTDQRSIDMVPAYFPHAIVRDDGCNVAYWNLDTRDLVWTGERYEVNGVPLRFFHFSGFNPQNPRILTMHHAGNPRILPSERPAVAKICREYAGLLRSAGYGKSARGYGYDVLPNGIRVDTFMRGLYRDTLRAAERGSGPAPPDPFHPSSVDAFMAWLSEPAGGARTQPVSRYLLQVHRVNPYLQAAFRLTSGAGVDAYLGWVARWGRFENQIPDALVPKRTRSSRRAAGVGQGNLDPGVNVAGYFRAEVGVGEAGRSVLRAVEAAGIPHRTVLHDVTLSRQEHPFTESELSRPTFDTNLICVNADAMPEFARQMGPTFFRSRYTIGMWHWEVEEFPWEMHRAFHHVQEVWVASEFSRQSVAKVAPCPVFAFPLPVLVPPSSPPLAGGDLKVPEGFTFLFVFDHLSVFKRKNPLAVIEAFRQAFKPGEGAFLVLKSINSDQDPLNQEELRAAVAGRSDLLLMEQYLNQEQTKALMATCDCYVSLHRSEGFGLTMAEAMSFGKPVIGTGYSGNLEFMNDANSYLVPYTLQPIGPGSEPYPPEARWAEPDIAVAAALMREVYEERGSAAAKGEQARTDLIRFHSAAARADFIKERVETGRQLRNLGFQRAPVVRAPTLLRGRASRAIVRAPARVVLRAMGRPIEAIRSPSYRHRRSAAFIKRIFRRPYEILWRAGHPPSDSLHDD